uniref:Calcineurin-like phosphoesterase domain-containing protein n=1 Tax=viral metagenome TaxID=1070528 RepID=A0A6M3LF23_9ZZZZ
MGLTPPKYQSQIKGKKYHKIQVECWEWYCKKLEELKPIDIFCVNGDLIDGTGDRSGGTELITTDMREQREMSVECIKKAHAETVLITRGTPFHVSPAGQDAEDDIGKEVKAKKVEDHGWYNINGVVFDVKHNVGSTSVPYSKGTQISKDQIWNLIWADYNDQPRARIFIRSHVHYFFHCGDTQWLGVTTPALMAMGSKYGARRCVQHIDFGLVHFDVYKDGSYTWMPHIIPVQAQKALAVKL